MRRFVDGAAGVAEAAAVVDFFGRPRAFLGGGAGSGVKSSSSSSCLNCGVLCRLLSPSESSIIGALRRVAAARNDFRGGAEDMFAFDDVVEGELVTLRSLAQGIGCPIDVVCICQ